MSIGPIRLIGPILLILLVVASALAQDAKPVATAPADETKIIVRGSSASLLEMPDVGDEARPVADTAARPGEIEFVVRRGDGELVFEEGILLTQPGSAEELRPILRMDAPGASDGKPTPATAPGPGNYGIRSSRTLDVEVTGGAVRLASPARVFWFAPEAPGWQKIGLVVEEKMTYPDNATPAGALPAAFSARREILAMVQYPYDAKGSGVIEGYPIGVYPDPNSPQANTYVERHKSLYEPPKWFIKVTPETENLKLSPHFTLGEFAPGTEAGKVRFMVVKPELLRFLEAYREAVRARWGDSARIRIHRGYLSPYERTRLAARGVNYTLFNRYQYGDAAALAVDIDGSGKMGDLNKDGQVDQADAVAALEVAERLQKELKLPGGIGMLEKPHEPDWPAGPSVAIDLRGVQTRW